jgi:hypothetical protein
VKRTIQLLRLMADRRQRTVLSMATSLGWTEEMAERTVKALRRQRHLSLRKRLPARYSITVSGYERSFYEPIPRARPGKPRPVVVEVPQFQNMQMVSRAISKQPDLVRAWRF